MRNNKIIETSLKEKALSSLREYLEYYCEQSEDPAVKNSEFIDETMETILSQILTDVDVGMFCKDNIDDAWSLKGE